MYDDDDDEDDYYSRAEQRRAEQQWQSQRDSQRLQRRMDKVDSFLPYSALSEICRQSVLVSKTPNPCRGTSIR